MSKRTSYAPGIPSWIDLMTPSRADSKAFYSALFGWTFEDVADGEGNVVYTQCFSNGGNVAGIAEMGPEMRASGMPAAWSTYVSTSDIAETTKKAEAAGGSVVMGPIQVMESGQVAVYIDPTGAAVGAWQAQNHPGATLVNEPYGFAWNELNTRDTAAAMPFYAAVFGWEGRTMEGPMQYTEWYLEGSPKDAVPVGGMLPMPEMVPAEVPAHWLTYFAVEDCDATAAKLTELGGTLINGPMDIPIGRFAVVQDPAGAVMCVMRLLETH